MEQSVATPATRSAYPVEYDVEYPDRDLNRLTTAFRTFTAIPIAVVSGALGGLLFLPPLLMIVFRQKYPRWWHDFNVELLRFQARVGVYVALMDDRYPSTDEPQAVRLELPDPDAARLNRWLPLVKWLLAIPHYVVLAFLVIGAFFAVVAAWFAILFTGRFPRGLFDYLVGVGRWTNRVIAYAFALVTDEYPPFRLRP
ncbi:MAG TPA: DUF4389 domain-containing protein [Solirubrobacteraceae bacterium]|nr:DUF4389 domain-containing protein [Solirubrobacteraceae bacterium]